jgi:hypothetical protein
MKETVAFGAERFYMENQEKFGNYNIVAFVDNDSSKWGKCICGKTIISIDDLGKFAETDILITSIYKYEILKQLVQKGVSTKRIRLLLPGWMDKFCDSANITENGGVNCQEQCTDSST